MLQYLLNYDTDIDGIEEINLEYDLDITDKTILQEQINNARKSYYNLMKIYDNLQGEYLEAKSELAKKMREAFIKYENRTERTNEISKDLSIINLEEKMEALKEAMKTLSNQIDFVKTDIRILTNSMYNR